MVNLQHSNESERMLTILVRNITAVIFYIVSIFFDVFNAVTWYVVCLILVHLYMPSAYMNVKDCLCVCTFILQIAHRYAAVLTSGPRRTTERQERAVPDVSLYIPNNPLPDRPRLLLRHHRQIRTELALYHGPAARA